MVVSELLLKNNILFTETEKDYLVRCLNPEHDDQNPSMRIDKLNGAYHCFSCGFSGSIYKYFGMHKSILDVMQVKLKDKIANHFYYNLSLPSDAIPYKGSYRDISSDTYKKFEAFTSNQKEMTDRVWFPIRNAVGDIVCFQGRALYDSIKPKYKFYPSHVSPPLFPAIPELIEDSIILVEGIFDVINLYDKGLTNAVCLFGTGNVSAKSEHKNVKLKDSLKSYIIMGVSRILIMLDSDEPGQQASKRLYNILKKTVVTELVELEDNKDPGSLTQAEVDRIKRLAYNASSNS